MNDIMPTVRLIFSIAAMVCAAVALSKLGGLRLVALGSAVEWAAVAIACAQVR